MAEMTLSNQMKGGGEEQRHGSADEIVPVPVREQYGVLRFMNDGIDGVHHDAEHQREACQEPTIVDA